jgi:hypothetical protein
MIALESDMLRETAEAYREAIRMIALEPNMLREAADELKRLYKQALMEVLAKRTGLAITSPEVEAAADRIVGKTYEDRQGQQEKA